MRFIEATPADFPGKEFALRWGSDRLHEYIYEVNELRYGQTTNGETVITPYINYEVYVESEGKPYAEISGAKIGIEHMDEGQRNALELADKIENNPRKYGSENSFTHLSEVRIDNSGLFYINADQEGSRLHDCQPIAAVKSIKKLKIVDFATSTRGYYGAFKYDKADIPAFVPSGQAEEVNAYRFIDQPRIVVSESGDYDFQIAKILLMKIESDITYPLGSLDVSYRW